MGPFVFELAEREGFEPSIGYSPIHTFQACSLNHSDISPEISRVNCRWLLEYPREGLIRIHSLRLLTPSGSTVCVPIRDANRSNPR